jgi:hypothetical protein
MATLVRKRRNDGQVFFQAVGVSALTTTIALLSFSYQEASHWAVIRNAEALVSQVWCHAMRPTDRVPVQAHSPEPAYGQYFRRADEVRPGVRRLKDAKSPDERSSESRKQAHCDHGSRKRAQKSARAATPFRIQIQIRREQRMQKVVREHAQGAAKRAGARELHDDLSQAQKRQQGPQPGTRHGLVDGGYKAKGADHSAGASLI